MKLIIYNENKELSRNKKRKIERRNRMNDDIKLLLNKIKTQKKKKYKNDEKIKQLEFLLVRIKYADKPDKLESALKEINKIQVVNKNLHEIEQKILNDYVGEFEMVRNLKIGDQNRKTRIRFRNIDDYEAYFYAIDQNFDSEDALLNGYMYNLNTPQFKKVNRSQYGKECDFKHETFEYRGNNCFIPTKGYCFVNCINFLTGQTYKE